MRVTFCSSEFLLRKPVAKRTRNGPLLRFRPFPRTRFSAQGSEFDPARFNDFCFLPFQHRSSVFPSTINTPNYQPPVSSRKVVGRSWKAVEGCGRLWKVSPDARVADVSPASPSE